MTVLKAVNYQRLSIYFFSILVALSFYVDMTFSFSHQGLITITLILMMPVSVGAWFRPILLRSITIMLALCLAALCQQFAFVLNGNLLFFLTVSLILASIIFMKEQYSAEWIFFLLTLSILNFMDKNVLSNQITDVLMATTVMLILSFLITLLIIRKTFFKLVLDYLTYLYKLVETIDDDKMDRLPFNVRLQQKAAWVFALGLTPGLRAGFRYYLLQLERACDLLFYIKRNINILNDNNVLYAKFISSITINRLLLIDLQNYFSGTQGERQEVDWMHDIASLEDAVNEELPINLQSLHFNADQLFIFSLLEACKDLRQVLLQLMLALPAKEE